MPKTLLSPAQLRTQAPAKLNLHLAVFPCQAGQLHPLESIMQSVSLVDTVSLEIHAYAGEISLNCNWAELQNKHNLAWRAAKLWQAATRTANALELCVTKRIPLEAGLGGGSADAAAVLRLLQAQAGSAGLPEGELLNLAARLGSDVPFCLHSGLAYVAGTGAELHKLPAKKDYYYLIVKPSLRLATSAAFAALDKLRAQSNRTLEWVALKQIVTQDRSEAWLRSSLQQFRNDFAALQQKQYPEIAAVLALLEAEEPLFTALSGSGPSCFALFETAEAATLAQKRLRACLDSSYQLFSAHSVSLSPIELVP